MASRRVFLNRIHGEPAIGECHGQGIFTELHFSEREFSNEEIIFGLFFKGRFQFILSLRPTLVRSGMIARNVLCPAKPKTQAVLGRSEERRVGKECRSRWSRKH